LQIFPDSKVIWIPYLKGYPSVSSQISELKTLADSSELTLIEAPVESPPQVQESLDKYGESIDAILTIADPVSVTPDFFKVFAKYALENNIPLGGALYKFENYVSFFGVILDVKKSGEQAAQISDKVLKGTPAGTIPVISADSYIEIDYKSAKALGYEIPDGVIKQANRVIR
jgi:putative ABC transport system substrate-binding protein